MTDTVLTVIENTMLCSGVFKLVMKAENFIEPKCGQFINIEVPNRPDLILRRPFAICDYDTQKKHITVCYKVVGEGTKALSKTAPGAPIRAIYPLGNSFTLDETETKVLLIGGGVGIFPLLSVAKTYPNKQYFTMLGFKDKASAILLDEFENCSENLFLCTEDCSLGEGGYVTDLLADNLKKINPDVILACGPKNMFVSLKKALKDFDKKVLVSLEERMGCGIGACIVCTCAIKNNDGTVSNKRVCKDGPVFDFNEVTL